ncbi:MAG: long-chain fatty acid transporter, partial [Cyclobacteriaceae bacterium]|nr:long-chain fatty acid transporter [Cyclobacteriaceae bacterium]
LRTPGRLKGGVTLFFEKYGFVTADVEWVDYAGSNFSSNEFSFSDANQQIDRFQSVLNYKVGAEFRYNVARFRAGYSLQGDPLEETGVDRSRQSFTAGLGVHHKEFFADVAYVRSNYDKTASPYSGAPVALIDQTTENIVLTLGMKF